jgi:hypothetical protein
MTVNVKIEFISGTPNAVDVTLNLGQKKHVASTQTVIYNNVNSNDVIDVTGSALATTRINIDKPTTPATPFTIVPGPVNASFTIN